MARPVADETVYGRLIVEGTAAGFGQEIVRVDVWLDGTLVAACRPRPAGDEERRRDPTAQFVSSFRTVVDVGGVSTGRHLLRVVAWDAYLRSVAVDQFFVRQELALAPPPRDDGPVRVIAFYLPQYHPIPENDIWWGRGFTEWTNVARARPHFRGHYQPHIPADLGFYDLRLPDTRFQQAELARRYGIYGFAYYYYWFSGKRLLERPIEDLLASKSPQFPFCLCYANENWTRRWDGLANEILMAQSHSRQDDAAFARDVARFMRDERYIRVDGLPLLLIYRPGLLPEPSATVQTYREEFRKLGIGEVYLCSVQSFDRADPREFGFDAAVEFPPMAAGLGPDPNLNREREADVSAHLFDYDELVDLVSRREPEDYPLYRGVIPSWDNTPRRGANAISFVNASPEGYRRWLSRAADWTRSVHPPSRRFVFVNAWNEWGEGCHLEPDLRYGRLYLEATREVVGEGGRARVDERRPTFSVVIPSYNHQRYIAGALASVLDQSESDLEVILIDDGSSDDTIATARRFVESRDDARVKIFAQANRGAYVALNEGVRRSRGRYVAVLNSDDAFEPDRLRLLREHLDGGASLAFSRVRYYDDNDTDVTDVDGYAIALYRKQLGADNFPSLAYALLDFNISISTGNFVFTREIFDRIGGFSPLVLTHDWDFVLSAWRLGAVVYDPRDLYRYRLHATNSYRGYGTFGEMDGHRVMERFFGDADAVSRLRDPDPAYFERFIDERGLRQFGTFGTVRSVVSAG